MSPTETTGRFSRLSDDEAVAAGLRAPTEPRPEPPPGVYVQLYRGAYRDLPGAPKRDQLLRHVDQLAGLGLPGVVFHGFPEELLAAWDSLAKAAADRGLLALASWGLDSKGMSAQRKGVLVGDLLARRSCAAGLLDAEGQWDSDLGAADDMDEAGAVALCDEIARRAPGAWVGDQPWYAIDSHGNVRKTAKREREGGVFQGFPVDEFARVCTWGRFRQAYIYNHLGPAQGYAATFARMDREWGTVNPALEKAGLGRPLRVTLQGYRWKLHELVDALLTRHVAPAAPLVMWAEPFPDAVALRALRVVLKLQREGMAKVGCDARETIRKVQRELNTRGHALDVDGWCGDATAAALGLST